jgi:hypothetical protein
VLYLLASLVVQYGLGEAPLYIKSRLGDLFEGRVSMTLSSTRRVAAPASMTIVMSFHSLPTLSPNSASRSPHPTAVSAAAVIRALPDDLDRPAAVEGMDSGIGNGPSVQGLYGLRGGQAHSEKVMYGRRKVIIDEIRRRQAEGINTGAAVEEVELVRQRGRLSLHQLYQLLNRQKKSAPVVVATLCHSASAAAEERA